MPEARVGFIGGSGLYEMEGLTDTDEIVVDTPFGPPSDAIVTGALAGTRVAFLPRHGRGHRLSPSEIPARANIYALKSLGVRQIVSLSAVGSLKESIRPLDVVIPDQLIDRTRGRPSTFFGDGAVAHVAFADPFCPALSDVVERAARNHGVTTHSGGTYVVMEGPQFSTRAESELYRRWGADVIGMTALPEAKLAREAEICYATLAFVTDYDCWREAEEAVSVELIVKNLLENVDASKSIVRELAPAIPEGRDCACATALESAVITRLQHIPEETSQRLSLFLDKYIKVREEVG